ncbi:virulence factor TspB C-terminal domain-related protein [Acinetobacter nectaris]|uniref:virulence factor TspB C-terminal domain-related protein n=1 Tax=Acinetobacter nectaris TaxID=1219382 RepID=UPI001F3C1696|nr:virulence factor TspB C-terminal domain-related protein [Acinetobacter nectaris]MCF9045647.1 hypothetical protein [Acinetobacter nectaris]
MRKIIAFLLPLIIVTTSFASAVPKPTPEDVARKILSHNPASNDWKMENVSVRLGQVSGDLTQRAAANGSMYQVAEHVAVPANTAEVAKVALDAAKKLAKIGGLSLGGALAVDYGIKKLLDGVDFVIKDGALVKHSDGLCTSDGSSCRASQYLYRDDRGYYFNSVSSACNSYFNRFSGYSSSDYDCRMRSDSDNALMIYSKGTSSGWESRTYRVSNPSYDPLSPSPSTPDADGNIPVSDAEAIPTLAQLMNADTTGTYDPVIKYAYTPKEADGVTPKPATYVDWGVNGFTPEMSQNLIDNRNAVLQAQLTQQNYDALNQAVKDPTQSMTTTTPDGHSQTTTTKPDGTKVTTSTDTVTDPKTGQQTTTTTVTTTKPDGTQSTEQTNTTADNIKTKTDLPAFCDYFSSLCKWLDWTQEQPTDSDKEDGHVDVDSPTNFDFSVFRTDRVSASHTCPAPTQVNLNLMTASVSYQFDYSPFCHFLELIHPIVIAIGWLSAAYILLGYTRDG